MLYFTIATFCVFNDGSIKHSSHVWYYISTYKTTNKYVVFHEHVLIGNLFDEGSSDIRRTFGII